MADAADQDANQAKTEANRRFEVLAEATLDEILARHPEEATMLGDHRHDDRLSDPRPAALEEERRVVGRRLAEVSAIDLADLDPGNRVDAQILDGRLAERLFELDELREHEWNPLMANPGTAIYTLLSRDFAPLADRLRSVAARLAAVPEHLDAARRMLGEMPRVHVETAIGQFGGTASFVQAEIDRALASCPSMRGEIDAVRPAALEAIEDHRRWLGERLDDANRDPRLGPELYERKLAHTLDAASDPGAILARAENDLLAAEERIAEVAARLDGQAGLSGPALVRHVLDGLAVDHPDNDTVVATCERAMAEATEFVTRQGFVTLHDDPVEIIVMPEFHRGVAVAYCDPPGPLEPAPLPTFFAISPAPDDWPAERVESYFREYNVHMLHEMAIHEAIPGHMLQLAHMRRFRAPTRVRAAFWSGSFVEGWAVYAERLMGDHGYGGDPVHMQRLKTALRMITNAIIDARVHAHGMTEDEAMRMMMERGHQEEGEAAGKWRRALLTSAQLSTYYVGYTEVSDVVADLRAARPDLAEREVHDLLLSQGAPSPKYLPSLLLPG